LQAVGTPIKQEPAGTPKTGDGTPIPKKRGRPPKNGGVGALAAAAGTAAARTESTATIDSSFMSDQLPEPVLPAAPAAIAVVPAASAPLNDAVTVQQLKDELVQLKNKVEQLENQLENKVDEIVQKTLVEAFANKRARTK